MHTPHKIQLTSKRSHPHTQWFILSAVSKWSVTGQVGLWQNKSLDAHTWQIQRPILAPETDNGPPKNKFHYEGLQETSIVLPKGHQKKAGVSRPLPCDIRFDRDQKVELRDGTHIRVDIFRPADLPADAKIPAIVMWSPYGNHGVGFPNLECTYHSAAHFRGFI